MREMNLSFDFTQRIKKRLKSFYLYFRVGNHSASSLTKVTGSVTLISVMPIALVIRCQKIATPESDSALSSQNLSTERSSDLCMLAQKSKLLLNYAEDRRTVGLQVAI